MGLPLTAFAWTKAYRKEGSAKLDNAVGSLDVTLIRNIIITNDNTSVLDVSAPKCRSYV